MADGDPEEGPSALRIVGAELMYVALERGTPNRAAFAFSFLLSPFSTFHQRLTIRVAENLTSSDSMARKNKDTCFLERNSSSAGQH